MNILQYKKKTSKFNFVLRYLCSLAIVAPIVNTQFTHLANAQTIDPSLATCSLSTDTANINLGDVNPITNPQVAISRNLRINCSTFGYYGPSGDGNYVPQAAACIGVRTLAGDVGGTRTKKLYRQKTVEEGGGIDLTHSLDFDIYNTDATGATTGAAIGTGEIGGGRPMSLGLSGTPFGGPVPPTAPRNISTFYTIGMRLLDPPILNIPVGTYSNTFQYYLYSGSPLPNGGLTAATRPDSSDGCHLSFGTPTIVNFTVTARVLAGCSVEIKHINFGEYIDIRRDLEMEGAVNLRCNVNAPYEIQINGGKSGDINARKMYFLGANGIEDRSKAIPYHIYLPNTQTEWGVTKGSNSYVGTTSANDTSIKVKAVIRAAEVVNPDTGTYKDTVTVTTIY